MMEKVASLHLKICLILVSVLSLVTNCQEELTMTLEQSPGIEGSPAILLCSYTILDSSYALFDLEWFKGDSFTGTLTLKIADFYRAKTSPSYYNGYGNSSRYEISRDSNSSSTFKILNVGFSSDRGRYWCRVTVKPTPVTGATVEEKDSTYLDVYVLPTSLLLFDATGNYLTNGGISYLIEGQERQYSCQVPGIHPAATFTWTVGNQTLMPYADDDHVGTDGLINSTSWITLSATWANHGEMLRCQATNKDGNPGLILDVKLDVKVLPKSSHMSLSDSTGTLGDEADVFEGLEYTFTCKVLGTRPAATIKWFLNNVEQTVINPNLGGDNELVDTEGDWTFVPERVNHREIVKCEAHVAGSQPLFPSVSTTLNVNGTGIPNSPTNVEMTSRTSSSITVSWSASYDGGQDQWFYVSHKENGSAMGNELLSDEITGGLTMYKVTELDSYTQYEISVYAENIVGSISYPSSIVEYTLPDVPNQASGFILEFNTDQGIVRITGLTDNGCIQLEVKYEGINDWMDCGECITSDSEVEVSKWCRHQTQKQRRRRAAGDIKDVRARFCVMNAELCSDSYLINKVMDPGLQSGPTYLVVIGVAVGVVLLVAVVVVGTILIRKRQHRRNEQRKLLSPITFNRAKQRDGNIHNVSLDYEDVNDELGQPVYANLPSMNEEFPREHLHIIKELGSGAFGQVLLAEAKGIVIGSNVTLVAVKTLKEGAAMTEKQDMIRELELMKKLPQHNNIVQLLGFCVEQDPPYILIEYLPGGNLKDFMKDSRYKGGGFYGNLHGVSKSLTSRDLMKFACDVAEGMNFISTHKCIHRDLAARNVLVAEDMTCKVSDFGLARDVIDTRAYERQSEGRLPLRWMALESVLDDVYTTKSDVWSFGVLLWEIVTLGARPYPDMSAKMMVQELRSGYRMPKPSHCQQNLYDMMLNCWNKDPDSRPSFFMISAEFNRLMEEGAEYIQIIGLEETVYEVTIPNDIGERV